MGSAPTVIIADDHELLRLALSRLLTGDGGYRVVASVGDAASALHACAQHRPGLLLLDLEMPGRDAVSVVSEIRSVSPSTKVVVLSAFCRDALISAALKAGVDGYLVKTEPPSVILGSLRRVLAGEQVYSACVQERLAPPGEGRGAKRRLSASCTLIDKLTPREIEVLRYLGKGLSNDEMARTMHLSPRTVERHLSRLMDAVGIRDRTKLTRLAFDAGLVS